MRTVICLEASHQRGMGHLFRGLTLGDALRSRGHTVTFAINPDPRSQALLDAERFQVVAIDSFDDSRAWEGDLLATLQPNCWIDDRLDTSWRHANFLLSHGLDFVTFDDHGTGAHLARHNVLAMDPEPETMPKNALCGPDYMILPRVIEQLRKTVRTTSHPPQLLLTFGGSDTYGVTPRVLEVVNRLTLSARIQVVVGPNFKHNEELDRALDAYSGIVEALRSVPDLLPLMATADLVLCGGGVTLYQAAALGCPTMAVANEPHELPVIRYFEGRGATLNLGLQTEPFERRLEAQLPGLLDDPSRLDRMHDHALALVDGKGLERVVDMIEAHL